MIRRRCFVLLGALLLGCANWTLPVEEAPVVADLPDQPPRVQPPPPSLPARPIVSSLGIVNADGTGFRFLVTGNWPAWSPDGKQLAFHRGDTTQIINVATGESQVVAPGREPSWSPDGTRLAMVTAEGIVAIQTDGSGMRLLLPHNFRNPAPFQFDMGIGKPAWSPDGSQIAFEHLGDEDVWPAQSFVMNADGSAPRLVSIIPDRKYAESDPSWSPDGNQIVFWSYGFGIASAPAAGGLPWAIYGGLPTVAYGARPAWSPDGTTIMFTANQYTSAGPSVWQVPSTRGPVTVLAEGAAEAVWSPDGSHIALVRVTVPTGGAGR